MKVLLLCDDYYHPAKIPSDGVKPLESQGFNIETITDTSSFDPAILPEYDAIILSKCDHISQENNDPWKTKAVQTAFIKYVENGGGLVVTHSGTVSNENNENTAALDNLIGCRFTFHPNNCPVWVSPLKPHPITKNAEIFCETDEHYSIEILADDIDILAASYSAAQGEEAKYKTEPYFNAPAALTPSVYTRTQEKGRICVLTPGHTQEVWQNPNFQTLLKNALNWCAKK